MHRFLYVSRWCIYIYKRERERKRGRKSEYHDGFLVSCRVVAKDSRSRRMWSGGNNQFQRINVPSGFCTDINHTSNTEHSSYHSQRFLQQAVPPPFLPQKPFIKSVVPSSCIFSSKTPRSPFLLFSLLHGLLLVLLNRTITWAYVISHSSSRSATVVSTHVCFFSQLFITQRKRRFENDLLCLLFVGSAF